MQPEATVLSCGVLPERGRGQERMLVERVGVVSAFVISEVEILNEDAAVQFRQLAAASIEAYGGRYLARAAEAIVVEGEPTQRRIVLQSSPLWNRSAPGIPLPSTLRRQGLAVPRWIDD